MQGKVPKTFERFDGVSHKDEVKKALREHQGLDNVYVYEVLEYNTELRLVLVRDIEHYEHYCSPEELIKRW